MKKDKKRAAGERAQSRRSITDMMLLAQTEPGISVSASAFDADEDVLNTPHGVIDLRTGEVLPPDPSQLHFKSTAVSCANGMPTPYFDKFMSEVFGGDAEVIDFFMRWSGYELTGRMDERKIVVATGAGGNGKSTAFNIKLALLGSYASTLAMETLMRQRPGAIRNDIAALQGVRLAVANEGNRGQTMDTAMVKSLTGRDNVSARRLYGEPFEFTPQAKITIVSNHLPQVDGEDQAIWDRLVILPFNRRFRPEEQDRDLPRKLMAEGPGILAKLVGEAQAWYRDGLCVPASLKVATDAYRREMDVISGFLAERCTLTADAEAPASLLYREFADYVRDLGVLLPTQAEFGRALSERGVGKRRSGVVYRTGVALRPLDFTGGAL